LKNEKTTISDIANALGISPVSISRALTGQQGVSEELKTKIIEKAKEMGYTKSRKNRQLNILVLYQQSYMMDNNNLTHKVQGIEKALQNANTYYHMEFINKESQEKMVLPYKLSKGETFDGVILIGNFNLDYANHIQQRIPNLVFLTGYYPSYNFDSVWFNSNNAGYKACEFLIKNGHQQICFIGNTKLYRNKERFLGLSIALEDYNLPVGKDAFLNLADYSNRLGGMITDKCLPTAIICDSDFTALEIIKLLYNHGLKVPDDISIIGSGNSEVAALSIPALTTLDFFVEYSCEVVVSTLLKRINQPDKPLESIAILSQFIERDSVRKI
jgi:Transcriptional regulators